MGWERFVLCLDLDIAQPWPSGARQHHAEGQHDLINTEGALYPVLRDRLRAEDGHWDRVGQAAVQLRADGDVPPRPGGHARGIQN